MSRCCARPSPAGSFTPIPLAWAPPAIASAFEIAGYDGAGNPATITAHVRFASTRLLVGDRDISGLAGCIGAPAIGLDGLYGIVSECEPNRAPVITRLSMAYSFLARNLPGLQPRPTLKEQP